MIKVDLPGRKQGRNRTPFFTFIGIDAVNAVRNWMPHRSTRTRAIFTDKDGKPLTRVGIQSYWLRHLKTRGLISVPEKAGRGTRYGKNPHKLRDLFRTRFHKSGADSLAAEFMMGHIVDPLGYNKAMSDIDYVHREYRKALPWLNIMTDDPEKVPVRDMNNLRAELEETRKTLKDAEWLLSDPEVASTLRSMVEERRRGKT